MKTKNFIFFATLFLVFAFAISCLFGWYLNQRYITNGKEWEGMMILPFNNPYFLLTMEAFSFPIAMTVVSFLVYLSGHNFYYFFYIKPEIFFKEERLKLKKYLNGGDSDMIAIKLILLWFLTFICFVLWVCICAYYLSELTGFEFGDSVIKILFATISGGVIGLGVTMFFDKPKPHSFGEWEKIAKAKE